MKTKQEAVTEYIVELRARLKKPFKTAGLYYVADASNHILCVCTSRTAANRIVRALDIASDSTAQRKVA